MNLRYLTKTTKDLKINEINEICKLKNQYWKNNIKNQISWFKKNIKLNDIHNLLIIDKKIVGYTCFRKKRLIAYFKNKIKKKDYLHFDTLIIEKKYQNKKLGSNLMKFNNKIINKSLKTSFLLCENKLVSWYKRFGWKIILKKKIFQNKYNKNYMCFNKNFLITKIKLII